MRRAAAAQRGMRRLGVRPQPGPALPGAMPAVVPRSPFGGPELPAPWWVQ